jgi:hypothetical protein
MTLFKLDVNMVEVNASAVCPQDSLEEHFN